MRPMKVHHCSQGHSGLFWQSRDNVSQALMSLSSQISNLYKTFFSPAIMYKFLNNQIKNERSWLFTLSNMAMFGIQRKVWLSDKILSIH